MSKPSRQTKPASAAPAIPPAAAPTDTATAVAGDTGNQPPATASIEQTATENDGGAQGDAQGKTVVEKSPAASAPVAPFDPSPVDAKKIFPVAREAILGTIGQWGEAGAAEVRRLAEELAEHEWSTGEAASIRAALEQVAGEARAVAAQLRVVHSLEAILEHHGLTDADVLDFNEATGVVITRAGRKLNL